MVFEYPSNFSNGTVVDGVGNFVKYGYFVTEGLLGYGFLAIIFIMSFVVGLGVGSRKALLSSSFITFIFSVWFWRLEMVQGAFVFALVLIMVIVVVLESSSKGGNI